jgi:hypothetical protein
LDSEVNVSLALLLGRKRAIDLQYTVARYQNQQYNKVYNTQQKRASSAHPTIYSTYTLLIPIPTPQAPPSYYYYYTCPSRPRARYIIIIPIMTRRAKRQLASMRHHDGWHFPAKSPRGVTLPYAQKLAAGSGKSRTPKVTPNASRR